MKGWEPGTKAVDAIILEPLSPPRGHPHYESAQEGYEGTMRGNWFLCLATRASLTILQLSSTISDNLITRDSLQYQPPSNHARPCTELYLLGLSLHSLNVYIETIHRGRKVVLSFTL